MFTSLPVTIAAKRQQADKQMSDHFRPSYITVATEANSQYVKSVSKDELVQEKGNKNCLESFSIFPLSIQNFFRPGPNLPHKKYHL